MSDSAVLIHIRFAPNGQVTEISECPAGLTPQAWFNRLSGCAAAGYRSLAGGRGVFRASRAALDDLKQAVVA